MANFSADDLQFMLPGAKQTSKDDDARARQIRSRQAQKVALTKNNTLSKRKTQQKAKPLVYRAGKAPNKQFADVSSPPIFLPKKSDTTLQLAVVSNEDQSYADAVVLGSSSSSDGSSSDEDEEEEKKERMSNSVSSSSSSSSSSSLLSNRVSKQRLAQSDNSSTFKNVCSSSSSSDDEEDDQEFQRRQQMKQRMLTGQQSSDSVVLPSIPSEVLSRGRVSLKASSSGSDSGSSSGSDSDGSGSDSDDDSDGQFHTSKPVFVPRSQRNVAVADAMHPTALQPSALADRQQKREMQRETDRIAATQQFLKQPANVVDANISSQTDLPDDTDGLDPSKEHSEWKLREFLRIHKSQTLGPAASSVTTSRKHMTDSEVQAEQATMGRNVEHEVMLQRKERKEKKEKKKEKRTKPKKIDDDVASGATRTAYVNKMDRPIHAHHRGAFN